MDGIIELPMEDLSSAKPNNPFLLAWYAYLAAPEPWRGPIALCLVLVLVGVYLFLHFRYKHWRDNEIQQLTTELQRVDDLTDQIAGVLWAVAEGFFAHSAPDREHYYRQLWAHLLNALLSALGTRRNERHRVSVLIPDDRQEYLVWYQGASFLPHEQKKVRHSIGSLDAFGSVAGKAYLTRESVYVPDVEQCPFWERSTTGHSYRTLYVVPLLADDKCWGVLCLDGRKKNMFTERDRTFVRLFAAIAVGIMGVERRLEGERGGRRARQEDAAKEDGLVGREASA